MKASDGGIKLQMSMEGGNGAWKRLARGRGWRNQVKFWQLHRLKRATWWVEASRRVPENPLMPQFILTDGHRAGDSVRTSPYKEEVQSCSC